jgi:3-methyladenine DNA glycosylase AlkD
VPLVERLIRNSGTWALVDEKEFFIRKAIGWVLREHARRRPDDVFEWLQPRAARASGVTLREAVKYLLPEQRDAFVLGHRTSAGRPRR